MILPLLTSIHAIFATSNPLELHLRADTGVVRDEKGRVALWKDLSARGTNFGAPENGGRIDSSMCPSLHLSGIAGRPSIHFSGNNALMDTTSLPLDSGATILIVAQDSGASDDRSALLDKGRDDLHLNLWNGVTGNLNFGVSWVGEIAKSSFQSAKPVVYGTSYGSQGDGSKARLFADMDALDSGNVIASTRNRRTWIGADHNGIELGYFLKGDISEIRVYRGALPDSIRKQVTDSLMVRYGIRPKPGNLMLHLRADSGVVRDEKGRVVLWKDLSARHTDFGVPMSDGHLDSSKCPTLRAAGLSGMPSIHFSGADALMDTSSLPLDSGATILIVAQDSGASDDRSALLDKGRGDLHLNLWNGITGNLNFGVSWVGEIAKSSFRTSAPALYEASYKSSADAGTARLFATGKLLDSGTVMASDRNRRTWLGADHDGSDLGYFLKGEISEILVYRGVLSEQERRSVEAELITKYSIVPATVGIQSKAAKNVSTAAFANGKIILNGSHALGLTDIHGRTIPFVRSSDAHGEILSIAGTSSGSLYLLRTNQGSIKVLDAGH